MITWGVLHALSCTQGKKENEYLAFTSRNKENKKYYSYLFMAKNSKMVTCVSICVCVLFDL